VASQARLLAAVAVGGALGSAARYGLALALPPPWAAVVVNASGCLLIGALVARHRHAVLLRAFLGTGVLGGYTTFSTASADTLALLAAGAVGPVVLHAAGTAATCVAAVLVGLRLGRRA
jgi:CrcB protein